MMNMAVDKCSECGKIATRKIILKSVSLDDYLPCNIKEGDEVNRAVIAHACTNCSEKLFNDVREGLDG